MKFSFSHPLRMFSVALLMAGVLALSPGARAQDACGDPDPRVEATPTPSPVPQAWTTGAAIGESPLNGAMTGGIITAPQDQTQETYDPLKVVVGPGEEMPAVVTEASDTDQWTRDDQDPCTPNSGTDLDSITYSWTADGGEFTEATNGASTKWRAPLAPGKYTLTCTIDDGGKLGEGAQGTRDDAAIASSCTVIVPSFSISFTQSKVAIGSKDNAAHKAAFTVTASDGEGNAVPDIDVPTPQVVAGGRDPYDGIAASVEMETSVTDSNGQAKGQLKSGNRLESTTIQIKNGPDNTNSGSEPKSVEQVWNELGDDSWSYDPYFYYDESSTISYRMAYQRGDEEVNITGHSMEPETTSIGGYEWNPAIGEDWDEDGTPDGDYEEATYSIDDTDKAGYNKWKGLVEWGSVSEDDGTYSVPQTIKYDEDFEVDTVYFWLWDNDSYDENGDD